MMRSVTLTAALDIPALLSASTDHAIAKKCGKAEAHCHAAPNAAVALAQLSEGGVGS